MLVPILQPCLYICMPDPLNLVHKKENSRNCDNRKSNCVGL